MKANEVFKLAEMMATFQMTKKEDKSMRKSRRGPPRHMKRLVDEDIIALLHKKLEEADTLKKILDDREKAGKKADDKKKLSVEQLAMLLVASYPIIGLAMFLLLRR